jgi:hypothetical protein
MGFQNQLRWCKILVKEFKTQIRVHPYSSVVKIQILIHPHSSAVKKFNICVYQRLSVVNLLPDTKYFNCI